jgi:hypothetical protein
VKAFCRLAKVRPQRLDRKRLPLWHHSHQWQRLESWRLGLLGSRLRITTIPVFSGQFSKITALLFGHLENRLYGMTTALE